MTIDFRYNASDNLRYIMNRFSSLRAQSHTCDNRKRACLSLTIRTKSSLAWNALVRKDTSLFWVCYWLNPRHALFLDASWFVSIFQLSQKLQIVNGFSPLEADIWLMLFTFAAPLESMISAIVVEKLKVPSIYIVIFASILQVIGFVLLSTLPASSDLIPAQYDYEVIAGFECDINISLLMLMTPFFVETRDKSKRPVPQQNMPVVRLLIRNASGGYGRCYSISCYGWRSRSCSRSDCSQWLRKSASHSVSLERESWFSVSISRHGCDVYNGSASVDQRCFCEEIQSSDENSSWVCSSADSLVYAYVAEKADKGLDTSKRDKDRGLRFLEEISIR